MMMYETRWDFVRSHVDSKRVLDIGPAELVGTAHPEKLDRWMHGKIAEVASGVVGLEKNAEQVSILADMAYDIREGDAEQFDLREEFDVAFAGELIEHLSSPGRFLDCARKHLRADGKILLTTPNRYSILSLCSVMKYGKVPAYRKAIAKHVSYFDEDSLTSLLQRHGFHCIKTGYCKWVGAPSTSWRVRLLLDVVKRSRPVLLPVLLALACK